ncbi:MAG: PIN domain-containing protein [Candidatus Diapherotrites archaeon]
MLLDTYVWIELFNGTDKGEKVKQLIQSNACFTSSISLAELSEWIEKEKLNRKEILSYVKNFSAIIEADQKTMELAGIIKVQKRKEMKGFGLVDAIILASAKEFNLTVVTGDKHFKEENSLIL